MKEYLIFDYMLNGFHYVDAYPFHGGIKDSGEITASMVMSGMDMNIGIVSSPSKNQARKAAYINWVNSTGEGFNKYSRSLIDSEFINQKMN